MKKLFLTIFIVFCFIVCLVPSLCMIFIQTNEPIGNEVVVEFPSITVDGQLNTNFIKELGNYFETHFAFRKELINADAEIQSNVFKRSNVDTVVVGKNNTLYYKSTLDNYLGRNTMTSRDVSNFTHNISMVKAYVEGQNAKFLLTIAPNKNSLYPEDMPYYENTKVSDVHNRDLINEALKNCDCGYLNLFDLFNAQDENLYLKEDSHWNNKGALLVYNEALNKLNCPHQSFDNAQALLKKDFEGDLAAMLYPAEGRTENNYKYDIEQKYTYVTDTKSVEESLIQTQNDEGTSSLLMYRDSFANSLIPFFANQFKEATFSKLTPYNLSLDMLVYKPEYVIMEKVERNVEDFITAPPVIPSGVVNLYLDAEEKESETTCDIVTTDANMSYVTVSGEIDNRYCDEDSEIFVSIDGNTFEPYYIRQNNSDFGYMAYIEKASLLIEDNQDKELDVKIIVHTGDKYYSLVNSKINYINNSEV